METHLQFYQYLYYFTHIWGSLFWMVPVSSVIESDYLTIKYGLGHFFNLFNFRIELVLKNMHFFSCLKSLLMARLKLNNTGQPSVDHHGPFGVFLFGQNFEILKIRTFFYCQKFFWQKAPPCFHLTVLHIFDCHSNGKVTI